MKTIIIAIVLLLSGCATTSDSNLLKGELFTAKKKYRNKEITHRIEIDDNFEIRFR